MKRDLGDDILRMWQRQWSLLSLQRLESLNEDRDGDFPSQQFFSIPPPQAPEDYRRVGPRPLPFLVSYMLSMWSSLIPWLSMFHLKDYPWHEEVLPLWEKLSDEVAQVQQEELLDGLRTRLEEKISSFIRGVLVYNQHSYKRQKSKAEVVWENGAATLLDYGSVSDQSVPVFLVPSLINRSYILDLSEESSFILFLKKNGFHPYLFDWGTPTQTEMEYTLSDYIQKPLSEAYSWTLARHKIPPILMGYCLGGILALALARDMPTSGLVLFATPWDFKTASPEGMGMLTDYAHYLEPILIKNDFLPGEYLQVIFHCLYPEGFLEKFGYFAQLSDAQKIQHFVAVEDWLNDSVPLVKNVSRECFYEWFQQNSLARGTWLLKKERLLPEKISVPTYSIIGEKDRLVPPSIAMPLANALPMNTTYLCPLGHAGMLTSQHARDFVWPPLVSWMHQLVSSEETAFVHSSKDLLMFKADRIS